MGFVDRNTLNTPNSEGISGSVNGLLISVSPNQSIWNGQLLLSNSQKPELFYRGSDDAASGFSKWAAFAKKSDLNNISNKLMLDGMKTLSVKWINGDTLEFYVDNTRVFGILAKWGGNYS